MLPRVSVLIGSYNSGATLRRAIDSILAQTIEDLELIVVDDGSTDDTPAITRGTGDPRVRHLPLPHMGISRSLNAGLAEATAEVVAVQDADDWSLPERLERELELLDARPDVAVVGCRMREIDEAGRELRARTAFATGDVRAALLRFNPIPNSCAAFRRQLVLDLGGFDPRYRFAMDYDLWLRVADGHAVFALDEILAVREMGSLNVAATHEREQIAETLRLRCAALARRRTLRGASGLALPAISYLVPLPLKRALRRHLGQAP